MAYNCDQCNATFSRKSNAKRHLSKSCKGSDLVSEVIKNGIELASPVNKKRKSCDEYNALYNLPENDIRFLPGSISALSKRFNELFPKYWLKKDVTVHNELVSLLDELLNQKAITPEVYKKMNNLLSSSIGNGFFNEELEKTISDVVAYLVSHDVKEIEELLNSFHDTAELLEDDILRLEQLTNQWVEYEIQGKQPTLDNIEQILRELSSSAIPRSKLLRFEMLLKDIQSNRYRVDAVIRQINGILSNPNQTPKRISESLRRMVRERLISEDQFESLNQEDLNLDKAVSVIKSTKIGRGVDFLPRETPDLVKTLKDLAFQFVADGTSTLRQKILSVLDELLFRKVITNKEHKNMTEASSN